MIAVAFLTPSVVILAIVYTMRTNSPDRRLLGVLVASISSAVFRYTLARGFLLNTMIDLCGDEPSRYFNKHGATHPNFEVWERAR